MKLIKKFLDILGNFLDSKFNQYPRICRMAKWLSPCGILQFKKISIPLVKRIYPQLIADKLVSVQPMTQPASLSFYLNYNYSSNKKNDNKEDNDNDSKIVF